MRSFTGSPVRQSPASSVHRIRSAEREGRDLRVEQSRRSPRPSGRCPPSLPEGVGSGHPEVYSNDSPGFSVGCLPTTPGPRTSSTVAGVVGDEPVARHQLHRFGAFVGDLDGVDEEPFLAAGPGPVRSVFRLHVHAHAARDRFRREHGSIMNDRPPQRQAPPPGPAGLCSALRSRAARARARAGRPSTCAGCRSRIRGLPRYPPLPVLSCAGFVPREDEDEDRLR